MTSEAESSSPHVGTTADVLRKGLGLRHPNLRDRLPARIQHSLGITGGDDYLIVRVKAARVVEQVIQNHYQRDSPAWRVCAATYNLTRDPALADVELASARRALAWPGPSAAKLRRTADPVHNRLRELLARPCAPMTAADLAAEVDLERRFEAGREARATVSSLPLLVRAAHGNGYRMAVTQLSSESLWVARRAGGRLVVTTTPQRERWVLAFTERSLLIGFTAAVAGYSWVDAALIDATSLIADIARDPRAIGLVVDPAPRSGLDDSATLPLHHDTVRALVTA